MPFDPMPFSYDESQSFEFIIGNTNRPGPTKFTVLLVPSENDGASGILQVEVTTPYKNPSIAFINVIDDN